MKRYGRKNDQVFLIHTSEVDNEIKNDDSRTKGVMVYLDDFKDMFFDKLIELPHIKEVNHAIDLVDDVALIANAPYHHYLAQNVELENQLKDMSNK